MVILLSGSICISFSVFTSISFYRCAVQPAFQPVFLYMSFFLCLLARASSPLFISYDTYQQKNK